MSCMLQAATAAVALKRVMSWISTLEADRLAPSDVILVDPSRPTPSPCPSIFSEPTKALSVIVPAYNEQDRIGTTLQEIMDYLQLRRNKQGPAFTYEVIVVDDGSKDRTVQVVMDFSRKHGFDAVRVLKVQPNRGKGHAVRRGMLIARGDYCLMADADGATRFSDLEVLEQALAGCITTGRSGQVCKHRPRPPPCISQRLLT